MKILVSLKIFVKNAIRKMKLLKNEKHALKKIAIDAESIGHLKVDTTISKIEERANKMETKINLSSPWVTYVRELQALFGEDPEITIVYDQDGNEVKLFVDNISKADALSKLLPEEKEFGNVKLKVTVVPANDGEESPLALMGKAFEGNPVLTNLQYVDSAIGHFAYAIFQNKVVQFYNDHLDDPHGNESTLYQEIAKDVFGSKPGLYYCTDIE